MLECPLNPRQVLHLGRPQDRTGSPILGDFEGYSPPKLGAGGRSSTFARGLVINGKVDRATCARTGNTNIRQSRVVQHEVVVV